MIVEVGMLRQDELCLGSAVLFDEHLLQLFIVHLHLVLALLQGVQAIEVCVVLAGCPARGWGLLPGLLLSPVGHYLGSGVRVLLD